MSEAVVDMRTGPATGITITLNLDVSGFVDGIERAMDQLRAMGETCSEGSEAASLFGLALDGLGAMLALDRVHGQVVDGLRART